MPWTAVFQIGVGYGLVLSVVFTTAVLAGVLTARDFMAHRYPPAIRDRYGERSARGKRVANWAGLLVGVATVAVFAGAVATLRARVGGDVGYGTAFAVVAVVMQTFNLYDLVVLDWLIVVVARPGFLVLPGTEGMPEYRDMRFHVRGFAIGIVLSFAVAAVAALVTVLLQALL